MIAQKVQLVKLALIRAGRKQNPQMLELTKEAEAKLRTLAECLNLENESTVVNELFYQFVLNQESDKRRMIMAVYQMNVKGASR
jgi:hypothetical protein